MVRISDRSGVHLDDAVAHGHRWPLVMGEPGPLIASGPLLHHGMKEQGLVLVDRLHALEDKPFHGLGAGGHRQAPIVVPGVVRESRSHAWHDVHAVNRPAGPRLRGQGRAIGRESQACEDGTAAHVVVEEDADRHVLARRAWRAGRDVPHDHLSCEVVPVEFVQALAREVDLNGLVGLLARWGIKLQGTEVALHHDCAEVAAHAGGGGAYRLVLSPGVEDPGAASLVHNAA
mmetsp:Transcript_64669/g.140852  ORF Transcript_64669/g.140852 Transcript_64669/m.140852 type:complete len:231 (-) Transcript_64669:330-1022(-)